MEKGETGTRIQFRTLSGLGTLEVEEWKPAWIVCRHTDSAWS